VALAGQNEILGSGEDGLRVLRLIDQVYKFRI